MDERTKLIGDWLGERYTVTELGVIYGVSRKTIYKWIERYRKEGPAGLEEKSRAPKHHPNAVPGEHIEKIVAMKKAHQKWGPKKLVVLLEEKYAGHWPSVSTVGTILKRQGLVKTRRKRRKVTPYQGPLHLGTGPNLIWNADFKGHFKTGDMRLCYPLTITDSYSRYLLLCRGLLRPTIDETWPWFEWVFREYGLPSAIRTDNGTPFASRGMGGLTRLSVKFIKLGIWPQRIEAGHPEQNGIHERVHRTMEDEGVTKPAQASIWTQQALFEEFAHTYNHDRPHEALGQKKPAAFYERSPRVYPERIVVASYDEGLAIRRVRHDGGINWKATVVYLTEALAGELVGLEQKDDFLWDVRFNFYPLGVLNERLGKVEEP